MEDLVFDTLELYELDQSASYFSEWPFVFLVGAGVLLVLCCAYFIFKKRRHDSQRSVNMDATKKNDSYQKKTHLWGYSDTEFVKTTKDTVMLSGDHYEIAGKVIPKLISFMLKIAKIQSSDIEEKPAIGDLEQIYARIEKQKRDTGRDVVLRDFFTSALTSKFGPDCVSEIVSFSGRDILAVSHGQTNNELVNTHYKTPSDATLLNDTVDAVFRPTKEEHLTALMTSVIDFNNSGKATGRHVIKLLPRGGGTNVTRCLNVERRSENQCIELFVSVDMTNFTGLISYDNQNNTAKFRAGTTGRQLEEELAKVGFMCGHEPDSVEFSTLGGWIATNASGMKRGRYGNIEDIVTTMDILCSKTPDKIVTIGTDLRSSTGPNVSQNLFGSEGSLAIIVNATIKIKRLPETKTYDSLVVPDWDTGVKFLKEVRETGQLPASLRMVDNLQFQFGQALKPKKSTVGEIVSSVQKKLLSAVGYDLNKICACTVVYEGSKNECATTRSRLGSIAKKYGIMSGGAENGKAGYNLTNAIAYIRDFANTLHVFGDTFECTVPWSQASIAGESIANELKQTHTRLKNLYPNVLKGEIFVSYRITQLYETGVCMYFTYAYYCHNFGCVDHSQKEIEGTLKSAVQNVDATLSHHHGIGKLKKEEFRKRNDASGEMVKGLKACFDPHDVVCGRNNHF
ncbi:hypothetical protein YASMINEVIRUS_991 [Yasminevirus sp. GU-2018]|uniref:FAD-binding PCMH-type domain-containing protein n=1 Tax=Yasminevirus sp. GU-2018 TaxID=2420051 RepID=A0A5K0U944_9VIRU|nr:hypothetical protein YASMINEVIRUS_991 [Yasminevirus sp. GU-2018]